jgi:hypothetical protein
MESLRPDVGGVVRRGLPSTLALLPAVVLVATARLTAWRVESDALGRTVISFHDDPTTLPAAGVVAAIASVALLVWSVWPRAHVRPHWIAVALGAVCAVVLAPVVAFVSSPLFLDQYKRGSVTAHGATWHWGLVGFTDLIATIAREVERDGARGRMVVVAERDLDEPPVFLMRPTGRVVEPFTAGADGRLYVLEGAQCLVALDPRADEAPARSAREGMPTRPQGLAPADISPFALLGPADRGNEDDAGLVLDCIRRECELGTSAYGPPAVGFPSERVLLDALASPNPWVRETARRFARAGGARLYPEASQRE